MVSTASLISIVISLILCFGTPILLFILVRKRANKLIVPLVAGMVGFFLMQIVIRIPVLSIIQLYTGLYEVNIFLLAFILASSAALFETFGRVMTVKLFMKDDNRFTSGLAHGIGHGGIEAILLVGMTFINNLVLSIMINNGSFDEMYINNPSIYAVKELLIDTVSWMFLLGGVERILAILLHISLSVLVVYAFKVKKKSPIVAVFLVHMFLDFMVVILGYYKVSPLMIELFILIITVVMIYVTYKVYCRYKEMKANEITIDENNIEEGELNV